MLRSFGRLAATNSRGAFAPSAARLGASRRAFAPSAPLFNAFRPSGVRLGALKRSIPRLGQSHGVTHGNLIISCRRMVFLFVFHQYDIMFRCAVWCDR